MRILTLLFLTLFLAGCGVNNVPAFRDQAVMRWNTLAQAYQDRARQIPTVMAIIRKNVRNEQTLFDDVEKARSRAMSFNISPATTQDAQAMFRYKIAQMQMTQAVAWLVDLPNNYPVLKTTQSYQTALQDLARADQRIEAARKEYNESVKVYDSELHTASGQFWHLIKYRGEKPMLMLPD